MDSASQRISTDRQTARGRRLATHVRFGVLGPLAVTAGDRELNLGGPKQRAALAVLLAGANSSVAADVIIEAVYYDHPPAKPRQAVSQMISTLRSTLGDHLESDRDGWSLTVPREDLDSQLFDDMVEKADTELDPLIKSRHLRDALALWRGHPYADVETHGYLEPERSRLMERRLTALEALNDAELDQGHHRELVASLEALVAEHPYREAFRLQHMLALYRSGRQAEALRSFGTLRDTLVSELGIEPSQDVAGLEQRILEQDESLLLPEAPLVRRRVVLAADAGDPRDIGGAGPASWLDSVELFHRTVTEAVDAEGGQVHTVAGAALYASFGSAVEALEGLRRALTEAKNSGSHVRAVLDAGDVEISDRTILGPPVVRAGRLLAAAHTNQVLLASDAHEALSRSGEGGWTASSLGSVTLPGVDESLAVYQLQMPLLPQEVRSVREELSPIRLPSSRTIGVAGYEIRERIGDGALGNLHLGYHRSSGREVWLELISPEIAGDSSFISRFEAVMQRLSDLDHPNLIVPVDHWRDPDGAYVVYPRHRGSTLENIAGESPSPDGLALVISALSHTHRWGVVHGSLGMSRIHIGEEGHPYLFGFSSGLGESSGQPHRYRAPEVVLDGPPSIESDIYALGVLAFEWLTGQEAPMDAAIPPTGLGSALDTAIARVTAEDPRERMSGLEALRSEISDGQTMARMRRDLRNPYKGLLSFQEADAGDFYGRDQAIEELTEAARTRRLVVVIGPSGIGKSSLVKAGLVPRVRAGILGEGEWLVAQMTPGRHPFEALRRSLTRIAILIPVSADAQFAEYDPAVLDVVERMLPVGARALLVVDQFEELYTLTTDSGERTAFLEFLQAASQPGSPLRVVLTLRADYLDHPLFDPEHGDLIRHSLIPLRAPNRDELKQAVVRPAESVGVEVEADLVERLVGDVVGEPGALPLTQLLLTGLFDNRETDRLTVTDYEQAGGVLASMADKAEHIYQELDASDQDITRQALLRLVIVSEDSADTRSRTRIGKLPPGSQQILESLAAERLVVFDHDPVTRETTVEVAHEALISGWPRLAGWVETMRGDLLLHRRLQEALADWQDHGQKDAYLLSARQLARHEEWTPDSEVALTAEEREFLERSQEWVDAQETRRRRRRRRVLTGFAAAAGVASVLGVAALINANEADAQRITAEANALAGFSGAVLEEDSELALLLAMKSVETQAGQSGIQALQDALQRHRHRQVVRATDAAAIDPRLPLGGAMSPNGQWVASVDDGQTVKLWALDDLDQPVKVIDYEGTSGRFANIVWFGKDNSSFLIFTIDPDVEGTPVLDYRIYSAPEGELLQSTPPPPLPCYRNTLGIPSQGSTPYMDLTQPMLFVTTDPLDDGTCPEFAPGTVWSYDLHTGETKPLWPGHPHAHPPTVSDDWTRLAVPQFERGAVVDLVSEQEILELPPGHADISGDGKIVLTGNRPAPAEAIWVEDGSQVSAIPASGFMYFSSSGDLVYAPFPGEVRVFDVWTGAQLYEVEGNNSAYPALSNDGTTLFSVGGESTMRISDVSSHIIGHTEATPMKPERGAFLSRGMGIAGDIVVSVARPVDGDRATHIYDRTNGDLVLTLDGIGRALSPDGSLLAIQTRPEIVELDADESNGHPGDYYLYGPLVLVDVATGEVVRELDGLCAWYNSPANEIPGPECSGFPRPWQDWVDIVEFSPDGSLLAVGGRSDYVAVWDTSTGEMVWSLDTPQGGSHWLISGHPTVAFSPDGSQLVVTQGTLQQGPERMLVVDTTTWETVAEPELPDVILDMEFVPDGSLMVAGTAVAQTLFVYDTETWEPTDLGSQGDWIRSTSVSPDSTRVATVTSDGQIWIWDVASGSVVQKLSVPAPTDLWKATFLDDDTLLVKSAEEIVTLFLDVDRLLEVARSRLTRTFTPEECATYDVDPCPTLEEMQAGDQKSP